MKESLKNYLSNKKIYSYRNKEYYKLKNYKHTFYLPKEIIESLSNAPKEVHLEQNQHLSSQQKGLAKWDASRKRIMLSENKLKVYFQPYDID